MTREERLETYTKMLSLAVKDLAMSRRFECKLNGFCEIARNLRISVYLLPELMAYRPDHGGGYWFSTDPHGPDATKRIDILKEIISKL